MDHFNAIRGTVTVGGTGNLTVSTTGAGKGRPLSTLTAGWTGGLRFDDPNGVDWELSLCTMLTTTTLSRDTLLCSSTGSKVNFAVGTTALQTVVAEQLNAMLSVSDIPFGAAIPFTRAGVAHMPQQTVSGALAFTVGAGAVKDAMVYLRLVSNGVNAPTFSGMSEVLGSAGYDNRNGILNIVELLFDGTDVLYSITQKIGAVPVVPAATATTLVGPSTSSVGSASGVFTATLSPAGSAASATVVVTPNDGGQGGTFSPTSVSLTTAAPSATFTYTAASAGSKTISTTNNGGLTNPAGVAVTVAAQAAAIQLISRSSDLTESASAPWVYTSSGAAFSSTIGGIASVALQAGTDGELRFKYTGYNSASSSTSETMIGVLPGSALVGYASLPYAFYTKASENRYQAFTSGSTQGTPTVTPTNGDILRMRRAGSTLYAEVSQDGGSTWTQVYGWASVSTGVLHFQIAQATGTGTINTITGSGLA